MDQEPKLSIKRDGNGSERASGLRTRVAVMEERMSTHDEEIERSRAAREEYIPRIERMESTLKNLAEELVPKLIVAVDNLTTAVANWNTTRNIVVKITGWSIGIITAIASTVIAAKLL